MWGRRSSMGKFSKAWLVMLAMVLLVSAGVRAQETQVTSDSSLATSESEDDQNSETSDAEEVAEEEGQEPEVEQPEINPDASFTPTEEISEDRPVPFPVDI